MNPIASVVEQNKGHRPRRVPFYTLGGQDPRLCSSIIDEGLDYIILIGSANGSVPHEGKYSFIPLIEKAISKKMPVYIIRDVYSSRNRLKDGTFHKFRKNLSFLNAPEVSAIKAGAIQLEKPDSYMLNSVVRTLDKIYSKKPSFDEGIEEVTKIYNSPEFNAKIKEIQGIPDKKSDN